MVCGERSISNEPGGEGKMAERYKSLLEMLGHTGKCFWEEMNCEVRQWFSLG